MPDTMRQTNQGGSTKVRQGSPDILTGRVRHRFLLRTSAPRRSERATRFVTWFTKLPHANGFETIRNNKRGVERGCFLSDRHLSDRRADPGHPCLSENRESSWGGDLHSADFGSQVQ
jgi:hypothetical protein